MSILGVLTESPDILYTRIGVKVLSAKSEKYRGRTYTHGNAKAGSEDFQQGMDPGVPTERKNGVNVLSEQKRRTDHKAYECIPCKNA